MRRLAFTLALAPAITGCSNFTNVPVVNMKSNIGGQPVCHTDYKTPKKKWWESKKKIEIGKAHELPYYYEGSSVAVCLPAEVVAYTVCVERLGLTETSGERSRKDDREFTLKVPKVEVEAGATVNSEQKTEVTAKFADEGPLAEARAEALRSCGEFLGHYVTYSLLEPDGRMLEERRGRYPLVGDQLVSKDGKMSYRIEKVNATSESIRVTVTATIITP